MNPQTPKWKEPLHKLSENNMAFVFAIFQFHPTCSFPADLIGFGRSLSSYLQGGQGDEGKRRWKSYREALEVHIQVSMEFLEVPLIRWWVAYTTTQMAIYIYIHLVYKWYIPCQLGENSIYHRSHLFLGEAETAIDTKVADFSPIHCSETKPPQMIPNRIFKYWWNRIWRLWFRARSTILISHLWKFGTSSTQNCLFLSG